MDTLETNLRAVNHGLTGAVIAIAVRQPLLAIPLAFLSHFICDAIPHSGGEGWDVRDKRFLRLLYLDMALAVVSTLVVAWVWHHIWWLVILCSFLAASPDLAWLYYRYFFPKKEFGKISEFHKNIQWSETHKGYYLELVWFLVFFAALIRTGM